MIEIDKFIIKKDGDIVVMPKDGTNQSASFLSGFDENENLRLVRVTNDGKLKVDASVSIGNVNIGDVNIRGFDPTNSPRNIGVTQFPDNTWGVNVKNKDLKFIDVDKLQVANFAKKGNSYDLLSLDNSGNLKVSVENVANVNINVSDFILDPVVFNVNSNNWQNVVTINTRKFKSKMIMVYNQDSNNSVNIEILGSLDNNVYDVIIDNNITIGPLGRYIREENKIFTGILIRARMVTSPVQIVVKSYIANV